MNNLKTLGLVSVAAVAFAAFTAGSATGATLEISGVTQNKAVAITAGLEAKTITVLAKTDGTVVNFCKKSHAAGTTSVFTGTVTGALSALNFTECEHTVTVHQAGQLYVKHVAGTTDGEVFSENAEVTVVTNLPTTFTVNCKTGSGTLIGYLEGVSSGDATLTVEAVLNCGFLLPSAVWAAVYKVTSPTGLGVVA